MSSNDIYVEFVNLHKIYSTLYSIMNTIALVVLLFGSLQMVHCKPVLEQNSEQSLQHKYSGVVLDAETLLPIPGATVLTPNQKGGTYCNSNGKFVLTTKTSLTYFIVRSVGYKQDTVRTNKESSSYTVRLQSQAKQTTNIVVQADKHAEDIVRTVLERMLRLRASVKELHYTEYTLEHVESNRKNGVKTALEKLKSVTKKYVPDECTRIQIMSSRFLGSSDTAVVIDEFSSEVDHLQNPFIIDGMEYSYPLSINGLKHYNYSIEKRNEEQECSTIVRFEPKLLFSRGFSGTVHICERDTTFLEVVLELQNSALPAPFYGYKLIRKFDSENPRLWFPVEDSMLLSMRAVVFTNMVSVEQHKRNYRKLKSFELFDEIIIQDDSALYDTSATLVQLHSIYSRRCIAELMKQNNLCALRKRKFHPTTDSSQTTQPAPNLLNQQFQPEGINQVWLSDFTELPCTTCKVYMATIHDLGSRRVLGFCIDRRMWTQTLLTAFFRALELRGFHARNLAQQPIIFHSDQGSQYDSKIFTSTLLANNFIPSMSRKGNCYDNAPMESFWSSMKAELSEHLPFRTIERATEVITEYIHNYYNTVRLHSAT